MKSCKTPCLVAAFAVGIALNLGLALMIARQFSPLSGSRVPPQFVMMNNNVDLNNIFDFNDVAIPNIEVAPEKPCPAAQLPEARGSVAQARDCNLSGPFTHGNLSVFLVHGPDTLKGKRIVTLQEALGQNLARVHDTGFHLTVDNLSDAPLFIQSGDIVKGGNQDRTLPYDQLIPPQTKGFQLQAFCVEQGRSGPRGDEISAFFQTSTEQLPGRQLKLAALHRKSQHDVWSGVSQTQANLTRNVGAPVQAAQSHTSLQLTLESPLVREAIDGYLGQLANVADGKKDVIGFAVAVNGRIQSADVYASASLFQTLWPKLLKASAVEALAERREGAFSTPTAKVVERFLGDAESGQAYRQELGGRLHLVRQETGQTLLFDTCDASQQNLVLHRSFFAR